MTATYRRLAAYVRLHARRRPDYIAVLRDGDAITYARLERDVAAMTEALAALGPDLDLAQGASVALNHHDLYVHLLMLTALDSLGVVFGSFRADEGVECHPLLANVDMVIAPVAIASPPCRRMFMVTPAWLDAVLAAPAARRALTPAAADAPLVILRSSGTTGTRKRMVVTHGMMAARLRHQRNAAIGLGLNRRSRFLATMHFSVSSITMAAINCLRLGATFMLHRRRNAAVVLAECQPTHLVTLPYQLRALVEMLPTGSSGPLLPRLTVQTLGAKLPDELRRAALHRLAGRVTEHYSSNETGAIGAVGEQGALRLAPGVSLRIIGANGAPARPGEVGAVSLRGPGTITGYLDDPAATAEILRDGWFHPGDLAVSDAQGRPRLVGRRVDVLNLGGIKLPSAELESRILAATRLRDVAVLQRNDSGASPPLTVCVVPKIGKGSRPDLPALAKIIGGLVAFPFNVQVVAEIPRTDEGKIKRRVLQQALFGPVKAGPMKTGPVAAGPGEAGPVAAGPAEAGPAEAGPEVMVVV
jgi:acyl-coenzyme A synthetase/AMP-(fatty) acid ligase